VTSGDRVSQAARSDAFDARDFLERYYEAVWDLAGGGVEALREWETDDIQYELPWSERLQAFQGLEAHAKVIGFLPLSLTSYEIRMTGFYPTADPNQFVIESTGVGQTIRGSEYRNDYVQFITFRDGKIARVREYFNTVKVKDLTG
jgi:ketosteroid isomerase-like protein